MSKEKIRDLLREVPITNKTYPEYIEALAEHLEANGTLLLPCKVGDTVYVPWRWDGQHAIAVTEIEEIVIYDAKNNWMFLINLKSDDESFNQAFGSWKNGQSIGETVFLSREEAEKHLKGTNDVKKD